MAWNAKPEHPVDVQKTVKAMQRRQRRAVFVRGESGRLMKGNEYPIGQSKKPCSHCLTRAQRLKWEVRYAKREGVGASIDRFCMTCRKELVLDASDPELQREYASQPEPPQPKPKPPVFGKEKIEFRIPWEKIAEREIGPNWRDA